MLPLLLLAMDRGRERARCGSAAADGLTIRKLPARPLPVVRSAGQADTSRPARGRFVRRDAPMVDRTARRGRASATDRPCRFGGDILEVVAFPVLDDDPVNGAQERAPSKAMAWGPNGATHAIGSTAAPVELTDRLDPHPGGNDKATHASGSPPASRIDGDCLSRSPAPPHDWTRAARSRPPRGRSWQSRGWRASPRSPG